MRNLKKFLALVLAMMMALSLMVTANAATSNVEWKDGDKMDPAFTEAVNVLSGMKVFQGDESGFRPDATITRAEVARIIYRIGTGDVNGVKEQMYANYGGFPDVRLDAWYAGAVGWGANRGIIKGENGEFKPDDPISGYEVLAMILRLIGYDKNGEFVGATWNTNVSAQATTLGILANVETTQYGGTLHLPARRDVVADLLFQTAAFVPQVRYELGYYNPYIGVAVTGGSTPVKNPTIGMQNFGLTWNRGVIVGNAATGEGEHVTKIGFSLESQRTGTVLDVVTDGNGAVTGVTTTGQSSFVTTIDNTMGIGANNGSAYVYASDTTQALPENVTRTFKWDSDLTKFGHAVKVWYDCRSSQYETVGDIDAATGTAKFTTNLTTYHVKDENVASTVVASTADINLANPVGFGGVVGGNRMGAQNGGVYWNYAFGPTVAYRSMDGTNVNSVDYESPVLKNNKTDKWPLYLLVSNTPGVLNMVVSLDMTITQITQENNTTAPFTVGVYNKNGLGTSYFDTWDTVTGATTTTYANIAQNRLVAGSVTTLGKKIAAIEITGTNPGNPYGTLNVGAPNSGNTGNVSAQGPLTSTFYYQLNELTRVVPGTVVKINNVTQEVFLSDGTTLKKSVFANAVDGTFKGNQYVNAPTVYSTYNFTLDQNGNYIYWEPIANTTKFVYGTYLDYTTPLNSSTYTYSMVGVDKDGKQTVDSPLNKYSTVADHNYYFPFANVQFYTQNGLPKRDAEDRNGFLTEGQYIGYTIDGSGNLTAVTDAAGGYGGTAEQPFLQDNGNFFGTSDTTITPRDATIGAVEVGTTGSGLFLTENTVFHLVSGAGTDTQKVRTIQGVSKLMEGMSSVVIDGDGTTGGTAGSLDAGIDYDQMIYYNEGPFVYAQDYVGSAKQVLTVFIPAEAVHFNPTVSSNLFFVGSKNANILNATGNVATQFTMYQNGAEKTVWIDGNYTDGTSDAWKITNNGDNVFYCLVDTGKKAVQDNQPIYRLTAVGNPDTTVIGQYWDGTTVSVTTNPTTAPARYTATTHNSQAAFISATAHTGTLYNVGSAAITNLNPWAYPGIQNNNLATLNQAGSLTDNVGVPVSCILSQNPAVVSVIYVNA